MTRSVSRQAYTRPV